MPVSRDEIIDRLKTVIDPELHRDIVSLKMVKNVVVEGDTVTVHVELTTPACPLKDRISKDVREAIVRLDGVRHAEVEFSASVRGNAQTQAQLPGVGNIVAVGSGKGGVGKSTVSVLLALALQRSGARVGLMDADIYGPSIPTMLGMEGARPGVVGQRIQPIEGFGVKVMSIGFMIEPDQAVVWRGPMVHGVVKQFLEQVNWGELDYLLVDLPPGTGDVPLTLAQSIPMTGAVVVCTPQDIALMDARRAVKMYAQLNVPCLGLIENMSYYLCPQCGHRDEIFDHGGAATAARQLDVPFLGEIPLNTRLREYADAGTLQKTYTDVGAILGQAIEKVAMAFAGQVSVRNAATPQPTLSVE